jgi:hypothetical protein
MAISGVEVASDRDWLVPFAAITALEVGLARSFGLAGTYLFLALGLAAIFALGLLCRSLVGMVRRREEHPLSALFRCIDWSRVAFAIVGIVVASLSFAALEVLKSEISLVIPFYADRYLALLDRMVFGEDAWRFFDRVLGPLAGPMGIFYGAWILGQMGTFTAVVLSPPSTRKTRAIVTYALMWFLFGTVLAYLLSSVGPLFFDEVYGGDRFAGLQRILSHTAFQADVAHSLWHSHQTGGLMVGSGISAMPSMHLAGATWLALLVRAWFPRFAVFGWIYVALIYVGSIMLGWHYASDGVIGVAGALLCWRVAPAFSSTLSFSWPSPKLASTC